MKNLKGFPVRMKCGPFLTLETWFFLIRLHQRQIALSKKFRNACFLNEGQKKMFSKAKYVIVLSKNFALSSNKKNNTAQHDG